MSVNPKMKHYKVIWHASWSAASESTIIAAESKVQVGRLWREAYGVVPKDIKQLGVKP